MFTQMRKIASVRRGEVIDKMFPHSLSLSRLESGEYDPLEDETEVEVPIVVQWPCSVQKNVQDQKSAPGGYVITSGYMILCPYIDTDDLSGTLKLTVEFDGKTRTVENTDIEIIDNNYIYDLSGWKIGCKIIVKGWMT